MATESSQGAQRQWPPGVLDLQRRAAENPQVGFQAFDTFPWARDQMFKTNLLRALYSIPSDPPQLAEVALHSRIERFAQQTGIVIDLDLYLSWLVSNADRRQPRLFSDEDLRREEFSTANPEERRLAVLQAELESAPKNATPDLAVPSWQRSAPTAELYVPKTTLSTDSGQEPYPKKFQDIFEFLQSGKEIPGIRQIPDTVIEDPSISTQGQRTVPLKPWEKRSQSADETGADASVENTEQYLRVLS
ncbi:hypothetical protein F5Y16DRAFT_339700 [Xylariaceae sp. FL0255]|nr:hypothetical protein F5Y16DRAFT_339700 [Xylariaceae sp. FL0255]